MQNAGEGPGVPHEDEAPLRRRSVVFSSQWGDAMGTRSPGRLVPPLGTGFVRLSSHSWALPFVMGRKEQESSVWACCHLLQGRQRPCKTAQLRLVGLRPGNNGTPMKSFTPGGVLLVSVFGQDGAGCRGNQQEGQRPGREAQFAGTPPAPGWRGPHAPGDGRGCAGPY